MNLRAVISVPQKRAIDAMPPPPAEPFAARIFLGPALRAQPDRRLVKLVREGYETAFEEIVRRYRKPLDRFAAAIVGGRSEDVTQDAFSKALLALRGTTTEIELKPWLYRIVRNTALNEIRDAPPPTEELGEAIPGGRSAAVEFERREEITELMERLRALPEPQRAAIVMRELEGLSHEEIAAALGVSGGAARQAIYRARLSLRDGFGLLIPLPLLRMLFDHGADAAGASAGGAVAAAGAASAAGGGAGTTLGGLGAAGAIKVGVATALIAGSVGAGVAIQQERNGRSGPDPAEASAAQLPVGNGRASSTYGAPDRSNQTALLIGSGKERGHGGSGRGDDKSSADHHGDGGGGSGNGAFDNSAHSGSGSEGTSGHDGRDSGHGGRSGSEDDSGESHSGEDGSGDSHSGGDSESGGGGSGKSSGESSHGGSDSDDSGGSGGSTSGGSGSSDDPLPAISPAPAPEPPPELDGGDAPEESGSGSSGSGSGSSGSGSSGGDL
jgi:RNA polymerase sigma factor (sigma-70 family)